MPEQKRPLSDVVVTSESENLPKEVNREYWEHLIAWETAPLTTHFLQLTEAGVELPDPGLLDDRQVPMKLLEVIDAMARLRVFITQTNHLSDRELYAELWGQVLRVETPDVPMDVYSAWHVDLLGGGGEPETRLYFMYYADEDERRDWLAEFPDYDMPVHEDPPYDRDRHLPQAYDDEEVFPRYGGFITP